MKTMRNMIGCTVALAALAMIQIPARAQITQGADVKVTLDNNNVDGGHDSVTPGVDGRNLEQQETTVAISPVNPFIIAVANNEFRSVFAPDDFFTWVGLNVSTDGGASWNNTYPPGFLNDTSAEGLASPLKGYRLAADPVVRFDAAGSLYLTALASNGFGDQPGGIDQVVFLAKYEYTPGTPAGVSTPHSAGNPPNFTYAFTTVVARGSSLSAHGLMGNRPDKEWLAIDTNPASSGFGNMYIAFGRIDGERPAPIAFTRSTDGGRTFSQPVLVSQRGGDNGIRLAFSIVTVARDGRVYVAYQTYGSQTDPPALIVIRSDDFGRHFGSPVTATINSPVPLGLSLEGLAFRASSDANIVADDTNPNTLYLAYQTLTGSPVHADIFVIRSTDAGATWGQPARVTDDATQKHKFFPTIGVSRGAVHVAWYDFRDSPNSGDPVLTNDVLNVYYASSNTTGVAYPAFSPNVRVSDVGQQPNCRVHFEFGTVAFMGDYIELAARFDGTNHIVHLAWADNRDIPPGKCDLDSAPGPFGDDFTGANNQNVYADRLIVAP